MKYLIAVVLTICALGIYLSAQGQASDLVQIEIIEDGTTNYLMSGAVEADEVEVTLSFARRLHIFSFEATGGTVHFESTHTGSAFDILITATARARTGDTWRSVLVILMSSVQSTPTLTPFTPVPPPTPTPTLVPPTPTPQPIPTITLQPVPTAIPTAVPTKGCQDSTDGCKAYLPLIYR